MCAVRASILYIPSLVCPDHLIYPPPSLTSSGYEPTAVFPHHEVQYNIALCIKELQDEEWDHRLNGLQTLFKNGPCIGLQLDMWTNTDTHIAYAGLNACTVLEPDSAKMTPTRARLPKHKLEQYFAMSEVLDFEVFPYTRHTGENIKEWLTSTLKRKGIRHRAVSGVTPDGAADGQCGINLIEDLSERLDTCDLHRLQRSVLFSIGLAGTVSKNPEAKELLKGYNRISQLSNQSREVHYGIRDMQVAAGVPPTSILGTVDTSTTRWGNQYCQAERTNVLHPVVNPTVENFKRENRGKKDAIVEDDEANPTSRVGKPVAAIQLGLDSAMWDAGMEIEAFLEYPYMVKEAVEHKGYLTGAQSLCLMHDLKQANAATQDLSVKIFPPTARLADRTRKTETRSANSLMDMVVTAREVLSNEIQDRFFAERPSNVRLVQIYMSKQRPAEKWLPPDWLVLARGLYLKMLRDAAIIAGVQVRTSPRKQAKKAGGLFRFSRSEVEPETDDGPLPSMDSVTDEVARWKSLATETVLECEDDDGLVNEFALMWKLRGSFPLHAIVFKQCASHMCHEGNSEQLFSRAGALSDGNGRSPPHRLAVWASIGCNRKVYEPPKQDILTRYFKKFSRGGKLDALEEYHVGLDGGDADGVQHDRADHFGRYGEPGAQTRGVHAGVHVNATQQAQGAEGEAEERGEGGLEEREE